LHNIIIINLLALEFYI